MQTSSLSFFSKVVWIIKMSWRDGVASRTRLVLFVSSIVLGIAAVVAIQSLGRNLKQNIEDQSRGLVGADYIIESPRTPTGELLEVVDSLPGIKAKGCNFASMVYFPGKAKSRLANVRALKGEFPFYGTMTTNPSFALKEFHQKECVLMDATVMLQYDLKRGDSVKIGETTFYIAGSVSGVPGQSGISASVAPPVFMPFDNLEGSGLLKKGSRIQYQFYFKTTEAVNLGKLKKDLEERLEKLDSKIETFQTLGSRMVKSYDNFSLFLQIIAFTSLILGCLGVASAISIYTKEKIPAVAILRCLGVTRRSAFLIYFIQIGIVGLLGSILGSLGGILIQKAFPVLLQGFLPFTLQIAIYPTIILSGILLGVIMSLLFSLIPLLTIWNTSPLNVFRNTTEVNASPIILRIGILMAILISIFVYAYVQMADLRQSIYFCVGVLVVFLSLSILSYIILIAVRKISPFVKIYTLKQSLLNLYRTNNQTSILVLSIGLSTFLISTLYFTKEIILNKLKVESNAKDPNIILFDIGSQQVSSVDSLLHSGTYPLLQSVPVITVRLSRIRGKEVKEIKKDTASGIKSWLLSREYRITYRDNLISSETVVQGKWIGKYSNTKAPIPISIEKGMAEDMKASVGDKLVFDVQGLLIETQIASIRTVDWQRIQTNFLVVFPTGVLENAPSFQVITTRASSDLNAAWLQQKIVTLFPNISVVDLRQVVALISNVVNQISSVVTFMALFAVGTGVVVLIGALRVSKNQRIKEAVLLRTLGAGKSQILKIALYEYSFLGLFSAIAGIGLSLIALNIIAVIGFKTSFFPAIVPFVVILTATVLICVIIGMLNSLSVMTRPPLEVLRKEVL